LSNHKRKKISSKVRRRVFERDGFRCVYCGCSSAEMTLSLDHKLPRSRGGEDTEDNLVVACCPCNVSKGDRTYEEWKGQDR
jgi:5-methylcytosine-specific restriction endonuclease McrA